MARFEIDISRNVVIKNEGCAIIISAYNKNYKAIRCGFSYLRANDMAEQIEFLFDNAKTILEWLNKCGKIDRVDKDTLIDNICFIYNQNKFVVNRSIDKDELKKSLYKAEQD